MAQKCRYRPLTEFEGHEGECVPGDRRTFRRTVEVSERVKCPRRGGRQSRLWAFGYEDMAALLGVSVGVVRMYISTKQLDPTSLESLVTLLFVGHRKRAQRILDAAAAEVVLQKPLS